MFPLFTCLFLAIQKTPKIKNTTSNGISRGADSSIPDLHTQLNYEIN
jgi:hypothetical protein